MRRWKGRGDREIYKNSKQEVKMWTGISVGIIILAVIGGLVMLEYLFEKVLGFYCKHHKTPQRLRFSYSIGRPIIKKGGDLVMLEVKCTNEEKVHFTVNPVTEVGHPVALDGPIEVSVQSGDGTVELDGPNAFWIISGDQPGDTLVLVIGRPNIIDLPKGAMAKNLGIVAEIPVPK